MSAWTQKRLDELARIRRGASPRPIDDPRWFAETGPGWVRISDVTKAGGRLQITEQCLSPEGVERSVRVGPGDVLMSICATIGEPVTVEMDACIHDGFVVFDRFDGKLDRQYLLHLLRAVAPMLRAQGQTGTQANLNTAIVGGYRVSLPKRVDEQHAIAAILDVVDKGIAQAEAVIRKLQQVRAGLLYDLLTRGIYENGELRDPLVHPEQFVESPLGNVPKEWSVSRLQSLCAYIGSGVTPRGGQDVYTSDGVTFIRSQNVTSEGLKLDGVAFIPAEIHRALRRSEVYEHDVLFNITGASIGRCCPVPDGLGPANVNQHVCILRVPAATAPDALILATLLASPIGQRQMEALNTMGNRQGLNYQQLGAFLIPWPEPAERSRIAASIDAFNCGLETEKSELAKLRMLKAGLMADLLTGRVRVPKDLEIEATA